jgi:rhodanese-related sulfurtransferase
MNAVANNMDHIISHVSYVISYCLLVGELKNALQVLSPEDFLKKYGTDKPKLDANLVFSCRSGKRSRNAMETAMSIGFLK